jgi:hypothetical protein
VAVCVSGYIQVCVVCMCVCVYAIPKCFKMCISGSYIYICIERERERESSHSLLRTQQISLKKKTCKKKPPGISFSFSSSYVALLGRGEIPRRAGPHRHEER